MRLVMKTNKIIIHIANFLDKSFGHYSSCQSANGRIHGFSFRNENQWSPLRGKSSFHVPLVCCTQTRFEDISTVEI